MNFQVRFDCNHSINGICARFFPFFSFKFLFISLKFYYKLKFVAYIIINGQFFKKQFRFIYDLPLGSLPIFSRQYSAFLVWFALKFIRLEEAVCFSS